MIDVLQLLYQGEEFNEAEARPKVRLVVPNSSCGGIIGKGGATIKYVYLHRPVLLCCVISGFVPIVVVNFIHKPVLYDDSTN
jgi:hypothetical protein